MHGVFTLFRIFVSMFISKTGSKLSFLTLTFSVLGFRVIRASDHDPGSMSIWVPAGHTSYAGTCNPVDEEAQGTGLSFRQDEGSLRWSSDQETKENCHDVSYLLPSTSGWASFGQMQQEVRGHSPMDAVHVGQNRRADSTTSWLVSGAGGKVV